MRVRLREISSTPIGLVLLLGSYDRRTKAVLLALRESLSKGLLSEAWFPLVLLLDNVEIYETSDSIVESKLTAIVESLDGRHSAFFVRGGKVLDAVELGGNRMNVESALAQRLPIEAGKTLVKLGLLHKLRALANAGAMVLLVRDQELTRGGEYIELAYLLGRTQLSGGAIWFFSREGVAISSMAQEMLEESGVNIRSYDSLTSLEDAALRILHYKGRGRGARTVK